MFLRNNKYSSLKFNKGGKENAIMSLVGKVIKESSGSANPQMVIKILKDLLK